MPKMPIHTGVVAKAALLHFAALLRVRRKERSLTLDELADRLGVSTPTVRKMLETGGQVSGLVVRRRLLDCGDDSPL